MRPGRALVTLWLLASAAAPAHAGRSAPDSLAVVEERFKVAPTDAELLALARRVAVQRAAVKRADANAVADAWQWLGRVHLQRVEYAAADSVMQQALALRRSARRHDARAEAVTLAWVAEAARVHKRLAVAESLSVAAIAALDALRPPDEAAALFARNTLGNVQAERGRPEQAVATFDDVIARLERAATRDSVMLGQALAWRGRARAVSDDTRGALDDYHRAAEVQERSLGPLSPAVATTWLMASMAEATLGNGVEARQAAERAVAIREQVFGSENTSVAVALSTLGSSWRLIGDNERALQYYRRAVEIQRAQPRPVPFDLSLALNNLGNASLNAGDGETAQRCLKEAREIRERAFGPGAGTGLWARTRMAEAWLQLGRPDSALAEVNLAFDALPEAERSRATVDLADARVRQGLAQWALGDRAAGVAALEDAEARLEQAIGAMSPHTLNTLAQVAAAHALTGDRTQALAEAARVEQRSQQVLWETARSLSEQEALEFEAHRGSGLDVSWTLASDSLGLDDAGRVGLADATFRSRLPVLDQLAEERRAVTAAPGPAADAARELESARAALAAAMVDALRQDRGEDSTVVAARERRERADRALAELAQGNAAAAQRVRAGYAQIAAALPPGSVLVSYVKHRVPAVQVGLPVPAPARYAALITRPGGGAPQVVPLGPAEPVEAAVARWVEACATPPPTDVALARAAERRCDAIGRAVYARVWAPVAARIAGAAHVYVVPEGVLHRMNFLALPTASGRLVEGRAVLQRLAAERDLLPWGEERAGEGLLAMGGADFDAGGVPATLVAASVRAGDDSLRLRFTPLPETAAEVEEIAGLWRRGGGEALLLTGAAATEAAFRSEAPGRRVLHVATHGFAVARSGAGAAARGLRAVGAVVGGRDTSLATSTSVLLPGVALAGANAPAAAGRDDGFLTAEEITSLDLTGTDWAVLSACETGRSDPAAAEAVQGLHRAFRRAGVHTVIVSLWAVDDASTREWMRELYGARLVRGLGTAESVAAACRAVIAERRGRGVDAHPFRWAGFVGVGGGR